MAFLDDLKEMIEGVRQEGYPKARNYIARKALDLGGANSDADAKKILHGQGNYNLTRGLAKVLPPEAAANVADLGYLGNEAFTGALAKLTGRPFFSDYGFRWKDVGINRGGQDRAVNDLSAEYAARSAKTARDPYNVR